MRLGLAVAVLVVLVAGCTSGDDLEPGQLPFVESVGRDRSEALLSTEADGVTVDVYDDGGCVTIVEHVPDYGYLEDEFCPSAPTADALGASFRTPNCPFTDFGDECRRWLPEFVIGHTVAEAAYVCTSSGRIEVHDGWWLATADDVNGEAFPLAADGVRLDSVSNEFDDRMRAACDAQDPELVEAQIEIRTGSYPLPITVELDVGVSGTFLLQPESEPYVFTANLPVGGAPMLVVVYEGTDGTGIGRVSVPAMPECEDAIFILDLAGPTGEWTCRE